MEIWTYFCNKFQRNIPHSGRFHFNNTSDINMKVSVRCRKYFFILTRILRESYEKTVSITVFKDSSVGNLPFLLLLELDEPSVIVIYWIIAIVIQFVISIYKNNFCQLWWYSVTFNLSRSSHRRKFWRFKNGSYILMLIKVNISPHFLECIYWHQISYTSKS